MGFMYMFPTYVFAKQEVAAQQTIRQTFAVSSMQCNTGCTLALPCCWLNLWEPAIDDNRRCHEYAHPYHLNGLGSDPQRLDSLPPLWVWLVCGCWLLF